jgi:hypothetical protein
MVTFDVADNQLGRFGPAVARLDRRLTGHGLIGVPSS